MGTPTAGHHVQVVAETHPTTGYREFRTDPADVETVDVLLEDYTGRQKAALVHRSAVLLMVPTSDIGALIFEPAMSAQGPVRDVKSGRPVWIQRVVLGQHEIWDLIGRQMKEQHERRPLLFPPNGRRM